MRWSAAHNREADLCLLSGLCLPAGRTDSDRPSEVPLMSDPLIASLSAAVEASPDDVPLRLHLVGLLLDAGRHADAVGHAAQALQRAPASPEAQELMRRALGGSAPTPASAPPAGRSP